MRLLLLALALPAMFIASGATILLIPDCGFAASLVTAYLVLTPLLYTVRNSLVFKPRGLLKPLAVFGALWGAELLLSPYLSQYNALMKFLIEVLSTCAHWEVYFFAASVLLAPIVEETIFRGMLHQEIEKRLGVLAGYVGNSMAFAVLHGLPSLIPLYFAYGLALTYAFKKGGLLSSMFLHGVNNLLAFFAILQQPQ
ncbi:MAG: CPBP family intramembrane glutamic endopeptidase [Pyrobaculum sp.]